MTEPCRCDAYHYPHRPGGGFCEAPRYVCDDCHHGFDEPMQRNYRAATRDEPAEWIDCCPECGSEDYTEAG